MSASDLDALVEGIRAADRTALGRAITMVESRAPSDRRVAAELVDRLLVGAGGAHRVGITGAPGVGKSTFIDELGSRLTARGRRVAVIAVDPSSSISGGSILGDRTRMPRLSVDPAAFVRPSPSSGTLGGVTRTTREAMVVLEAAGHDVVLAETVGVGQSEIAVADMVDFFLVLLQPGAGDELQGIKKGVLELADMLVVNKADGDNTAAARAAARDYQAALRLLTPVDPDWSPPVLTCSGLTGDGLDAVWDQIELHRRRLTESGGWDRHRRDQRMRWMWSMVEAELLERVRRDPAVGSVTADVEAAVAAGELSPPLAAARILSALEVQGSSGP